MRESSKLNKSKLANLEMKAMSLGSIKPKGWLRDQLEIQRDGLSGHLDEHWEDVGPNNGWIGGEGDSWERGPYYLDGLVPLAYLLEDDFLIEKSQPWIEWALDSQREDGSFGPNHLTTVNTEVTEQDWWQEIIMLKVLTQYQEATNDERVIPFMTKYFSYLKDELINLPLREWAEARGADLLLSIFWLYERTEDSMLLQLAETVRKQTINWNEIFSDFPYWRKQNQWDHRIHVVNVAMGIKAPAVFYRITENEWEKEAVYKGIQSLMTYHGQANGMFSGDEWLSGTHPSQGTELCSVVEYMFSLEQLITILGDGKFGDILDKVAFNALPATISPKWDSHQYDQQVNQIICNTAKRPWVNSPDANIFGLEPNFGCCTANMHQGWPKFTSSLWMEAANDGLAAISYAPCTVETVNSKGTNIKINVESDYPFRETVKIKINASKEDKFPVYLRIPEWCTEAKITVDGNVQDINVTKGFACIDRLWNNTNIIELTLPMKVQIDKRNNHAVSVNRGPLLYALPIDEHWVRIQERERFSDWEIYPKSSWNYALYKDTDFSLEEHKLLRQPFSPENAPVKLLVKGKLVSNWIMEKNSAGEPPLNPTPFPNSNVKTLKLIPYGCSRLRVGEFPSLREDKKR